MFDIEEDYNNSFKSYLICVSRNRPALWRHIFLHVRTFVTLFLNPSQFFPESGLVQRIFGACLVAFIVPPD